MSSDFEQRHNFVVDGLNAIKGIDCTPSQGTFYCFANIQQAITDTADVSNDVEFATFLLERCGVAVVPGSAFGLEGYMRISFANSRDNLTAALAKLKAVLG